MAPTTHRAYLFDWTAYNRELAPICRRALENRSVRPVLEFIVENRRRLVDPHTSAPLGDDWLLTAQDNFTRALGIALTAYYEPTEERGLGNIWEEVHAVLCATGASAAEADEFVHGLPLVSPDTVKTGNGQAGYLRGLGKIGEDRVLYALAAVRQACDHNGSGCGADPTDKDRERLDATLERLFETIEEAAITDVGLLINYGEAVPTP